MVDFAGGYSKLGGKSNQTFKQERRGGVIHRIEVLPEMVPSGVVQFRNLAILFHQVRGGAARLHTGGSAATDGLHKGVNNSSASIGFVTRSKQDGAGAIRKNPSQRGINLVHLWLVEVAASQVDRRELAIADQGRAIASPGERIKGNLYALAHAGAV